MKDWKKPRKCEVCKKEYIPNTTNQKICSDKCRDYKAHLNKKNSKILTLEEFVESKTKTCEECGIKLYDRELILISWRDDSYECKDCNKERKEVNKKILEQERRVYQEKKKAEKLANTKICPECGELFSHPYFKHCSLDCWKEEKHRNVAHMFSSETLFAVVDIIEESEQNGCKIEKVFISGEKILLNNLNGDDIIIDIIGENEDEK